MVPDIELWDSVGRVPTNPICHLICADGLRYLKELFIFITHGTYFVSLPFFFDCIAMGAYWAISLAFSSGFYECLFLFCIDYFLLSYLFSHFIFLYFFLFSLIFSYFIFLSFPPFNFMLCFSFQFIFLFMFLFILNLFMMFINSKGRITYLKNVHDIKKCFCVKKLFIH